MDDDVLVNLSALAAYLRDRRTLGNLYMVRTAAVADCARSCLCWCGADEAAAACTCRWAVLSGGRDTRRRCVCSGQRGDGTQLEPLRWNTFQQSKVRSVRNGRFGPGARRRVA